MNYPSDAFIIIALILVIVIQAIERYFHNEQTQKEQVRLIAAVLSKNMKEYTEAVKTEEKPVKPLVIHTDEVDLSNASDSEFDKYIEGQ
jgi:hypothetical protein